MSATRGGQRGILLIFGLLGPVACFDPNVDLPLEIETDTTGTTAAPAADDDSESTGDPDDGAPPPEDQCPQYCQIIDDHCQAEIAQYSGQAICEAVCALMDPGEADDVLGNTVGCRTHHALLAAESADPHCRHAGPTGDSTCGAECESFCSLALATCPGELSPFIDADDCIDQCEAWDPEPLYFAGVEDSDTYACRMHHLTLASLQPEVHCSHVATESPVCFDP